MTATIEIIYWRDIPAQVTARSGRSAHRIELPERFQIAIDQAATRAGKTSTDQYLAEWRKERTTGDGDLEVTASEEAARLEAAFDDALLQAYVRNEGRAP